jgi:hypothetical protein
MFAGHAALAFACRRPARDVSLGVLVAASFGLDLIWPIFVLLGVERVAIDPGNTAFTALDFQSYPWTHSLLLSVCWALVAGVVTWGLSRRAAGSLIVSALVLSHWLLDFVTHRPDLPIWPGSSAPMAGLGLWNSIAGTLLVEGSLFAGSIWLYARATRPRDRAGSIGMWSFAALVGVIWVSGPFSPPPPSADAVAVVALAVWLLPLWAWWFDRHREPRG